MILSLPGLTMLTTKAYLLTFLRILLRRKLDHDNIKTFTRCSRPTPARPIRLTRLRSLRRHLLSPTRTIHGLASGSATSEPSREASPDVLPRDPADIPDTTRDSAVPASLQPPADAPVELHHPHDQGSYRAPPDHMPSHGAMPEAAPSSDLQPSTAPPTLSQGDIGAILESATRNRSADGPHPPA